MLASSVTDSDTIAAISTPPGEGGVGIVRLSGPQALAIAEGFFRSSNKRDLRAAKQRVFHGHVLDHDGNRIDEVLVHRMRAPHSYTREDVIEINAHGGSGPLNAILDEALRRGARLARPGEFTQRAFLNGRIDLVQAEAVIDQIRARSRAGLQAANANAAGALSTEIHRLREVLFGALAHIEAAVDFPAEDLPELVNQPLLDGLDQAHKQMEALLETADAGRLYREGATIAIAGKPNVGKSSLFNALLRDARAIVTAQPGTTRDRLEECITLQGIPAKLIDTAGLRDAHDEIEQIGVERAREALDCAQLILFVTDASTPLAPEDQRAAEELTPRGVPIVHVRNKIDLPPSPRTAKLPAEFAGETRVSALTGEGLQQLEERLAQLLLGGVHIAAGQAMLTRVHQKDSLRRATQCVGQLLADTTLSPEFLALELRDALDALGEITGETTPEALLDTIFANFCIGK